MRLVLIVFRLGIVLCLASPMYADILVPAKFEDQSPREAVRKKLFPEGSPKRDCKIASKDPAGVVESDPGLTTALQALIKGINASDADILVPLFHPQLKVKSGVVKGALTSISGISGANLDATLFRAYAMNSLTGETAAIPCPEDGLHLHPLYGHPFQVGAWIQVLGRDEISRVYVILIPTKDKWQIGAWHVQQWSHAGKDFMAWRDEAAALASKKDELAAWLYYDLTAKLMDGGKFIVFPVAADIAAERGKLLGGKPLIEALAAKLPKEKLVYASSLFSRKGVSILLRFGIPAEWSANAIREHCRQKFTELTKEPWMAAIAGIRCGYVMPQESTQKEGVLGGIFVDQASMNAK